MVKSGEPTIFRCIYEQFGHCNIIKHSQYCIVRLHCPQTNIRKIIAHNHCITGEYAHVQRQSAGEGNAKAPTHAEHRSGIISGTRKYPDIAPAAVVNTQTHTFCLLGERRLGMRVCVCVFASLRKQKANMLLSMLNAHCMRTLISTASGA